ncbi:Hypothetical predicted protein [Pelobates cultripes]|uniref:Uncharacterized protein n=1 Tax=Pelobates cultripes TaxID=61616 RepID=A0AAD1S2M9_PELCU|nr:Hypothetical predicted protein [Pelobates cultripes]
MAAAARTAHARPLGKGEKTAKERLRMRGPAENRGIDRDQNRERLRRAAKGSPAAPTQKRKRAG